MRFKALFPAILSIFLVLSGCFGGGGGNPVGGNPGGDNPGGDESPISLVVAEIIGPDTIPELESASYTVSATGDSGITYLWKLEPDTAGQLSDPLFAATDITAAEVDSDFQTLLTVTVDSDNCEPQTKYKGVMIIDEPIILTPPDTDAPIAMATAEPLSQIPGVDIYFTDDGSYDPGGGDIVKWEWDWNNDGLFDEEGFFANHAWQDSGTYLVQFRVTDDEGDTDTLDQPLSIYVGNGWGLTWGSSDGGFPYYGDNAVDLKLSVDGNIYVVANYGSEVDIDPSNITDNRPGGSYFSRFSPDGSLLNAFRIGASMDINSLDISPANEVCVAGKYGYTEPYSGDYVSFGFIGIYGIDGDHIQTKSYQDSIENGGYHQTTTKEYEGLQVASDTSGYYMIYRYDYDYSNQITQDAMSNSETRMTVQRYDLELKVEENYEWVYKTQSSGLGFFSSSGTIMDITDFQVVDGRILICGRENDIPKFFRGTQVNHYYQVNNFGDEHVYPSKFAYCPDGTVLITGRYYGQFDGHISAGISDCFLVKLGANGTILWSVSWGGSHSDLAEDVATDSNGNIYVFGTFVGSADFDTTDDVYEVTATRPPGDAFVLKMNPDGVSKWVRTFGGVESSFGVIFPHDIEVDSSNSIYLYGNFRGEMDVDPSENQQIHSANGIADIFLIKMTAGGTW
jgi:hypothetical protein